MGFVVIFGGECSFKKLTSCCEYLFNCEVVDVTGELGGYNFQWAFSSAYVCAKSLSDKNKKVTN